MLATLAAFAVLAPLTACGSDDTPAGERAADGLRRPVARTYWVLHGSLRGLVDRDQATTGEFRPCRGEDSDTVSYRIYAPVFATGPSSSAAEFTSEILRRFERAGWRLHPDGRGIHTAHRKGVTVSIRNFDKKLGVTDRTRGTKPFEAVYVQSGCADVGDARRKVTADADHYPDTWTASPIPSTFPSHDKSGGQ